MYVDDGDVPALGERGTQDRFGGMAGSRDVERGDRVTDQLLNAPAAGDLVRAVEVDAGLHVDQFLGDRLMLDDGLGSWTRSRG